MGPISDEHDVLSNDNEETNNAQLEEEIHQHMNLSKLEDLQAWPLQEVRRKWGKKWQNDCWKWD